MGVEEVHPGEEPLVGPEPVEPFSGRFDDCCGRSIRDAPAGGPAGPTPDLIVISLEALVQAVGAAKDGRTDEGCSPEALAAEYLGHGLEVCLESVDAVVSHPVLRRVEARQDRSMRGQGDGGDGIGAIEDDAARRQTGQGRSLYVDGTVRLQPVGSKGVDRDQEQGQLARLQIGSRTGALRLRLSAAAGAKVESCQGHEGHQLAPP